jgi:hypothetical protein
MGMQPVARGSHVSRQLVSRSSRPHSQIGTYTKKYTIIQAIKYLTSPAPARDPLTSPQ